MSVSSLAHEIEFPFSPERPSRGDTREQKQLDALARELLAALAREEALLRDKRDLAERQVTMTQECEHRLVNGLQLIASLLSMQSRTATTAEAAEQLTIAAGRVAALGRVHHRLHLLDHQDTVEVKHYLQHLCEDLSDLLLRQPTGQAVAVEGEAVEIPTAFAIPLGFIVNELITNSVKYAKGNISVRIETLAPAVHSVSDEGPLSPRRRQGARKPHFHFSENSLAAEKSIIVPGHRSFQDLCFRALQAVTTSILRPPL